jgi:hypothetical protein
MSTEQRAELASKDGQIYVFTFVRQPKWGEFLGPCIAKFVQDIDPSSLGDAIFKALSRHGREVTDSEVAAMGEPLKRETKCNNLRRLYQGMGQVIVSCRLNGNRESSYMLKPLRADGLNWFPIDEPPTELKGGVVAEQMGSIALQLLARSQYENSKAMPAAGAKTKKSPAKSKLTRPR